MSTQTHTNCLHCGLFIKKHRPHRKFCNAACRVAYCRSRFDKATKDPATLWRILNDKATQLESQAVAARAQADQFKPTVESNQ